MNDIDKKLAAIGKAISTIKKNMATRDDLKNLKAEFKDDLKGMATKDDLKKLETDLRDELKGMATKDDIKNMATKDDLKGMATKDDLKNLEIKLLAKMEESEMEIIAVVDEYKEDKENVRILEKRVDRLEDNAGLPPLPTQ